MIMIMDVSRVVSEQHNIPFGPRRIAIAVTVTIIIIIIILIRNNNSNRDR